MLGLMQRQAEYQQVTQLTYITQILKEALRYRRPRPPTVSRR